MQLYTVASQFGIMSSCIYIFLKMGGYKETVYDLVFLAVVSFIGSCFYAMIQPFVPRPLLNFIVCALIYITVIFLLKTDPLTPAFALMLAYDISVSLLYVFKLPETIAGGYPLAVTAAASVLQIAAAYALIKLKIIPDGARFRRGKLEWAMALAATAAVFFFDARFANDTGPEGTRFMLYLAVIGAGIVISLYISAKSQRRLSLYNHNMDLLEKEAAVLKKENESLKEQLQAAAHANHKSNTRLDALERNIKKRLLQTGPYNAEFSKEFGDMLNDIGRLSNDLNSIYSRYMPKSPAPSVKVDMIDNIFDYFADLCSKKNIGFKLNIMADVVFMTENIIPAGNLETLISDLLNNAVFAVESSENPFRGIFVTVGVRKGFYEFTVSDSGVPFPAGVLTRLGTNTVTTHPNAGGSGIGFITTFETMKRCGASLIVHERKPGEIGYTKSVTVRFDYGNNYIIETYSPEDFVLSNRYEVVDLNSR